jgi:hypothetical protein
MAVAENRLLPLLARDGLHWKLGSLTTGSGFAYGGGYRHRRLFDGQGAFSLCLIRLCSRLAFSLPSRLPSPYFSLTPVLSVGFFSGENPRLISGKWMSPHTKSGFWWAGAFSWLFNLSSR